MWLSVADSWNVPSVWNSCELEKSDHGCSSWQKPKFGISILRSKTSPKVKFRRMGTRKRKDLKTDSAYAACFLELNQRLIKGSCGLYKWLNGRCVLWGRSEDGLPRWGRLGTDDGVIFVHHHVFGGGVHIFCWKKRFCLLLLTFVERC